MFLVLSKVNETSARLAGLRLFDPLKITLSIFSERSIRVLCSPNTQRIASTTFDFPQPLGPTIAVTPSLKLMVILSPKLLNPLISNDVSCIIYGNPSENPDLQNSYIFLFYANEKMKG